MTQSKLGESTAEPNLFALTLAALVCNDVAKKTAQCASLRQRWNDGELNVSPTALVEITVPGRPDSPELVAPKRLAKRRFGTPAGRAVIVHAVAHIEFNAMNLALDALYRYQDMPRQYYDDWTRVVAEEASHCNLMIKRLGEMGHQYGDFPAHDGLWEMAVNTAHDFLHRMAMVPRVFEARGLDVTPPMIERFRNAGDMETVACLDVILREEVGHVAIGNRWFEWACEQQGKDPLPTFRALLDQYLSGNLRGPFHIEARREAGFPEEELQWLKTL